MKSFYPYPRFGRALPHQVIKKTLPLCLAACVAWTIPVLAQSGTPGAGGNRGTGSASPSGVAGVPSGQGAAAGAAGANAGQTMTPSVDASDGLVKRGPRIVLMQGGKTTLVDQPMTLSNGTRVEPDGTFTRADRTQGKLRDGEMMSLAGMVRPVPLGTPTTPVTSGGETQVTKKTAEPSAGPVRAGDGTSAR